MEEKERQRSESIWEVRSTAVPRLSEHVFAPNHLVIVGILPNVNSINLNRVVNSVISGGLHTVRLKVNLAKKPKKDGDKSAVLVLKDVRQLSCVFHDTDPAESLPILRKSKKVLRSTPRVQFTQATQRHANIRENKGPLLAKIQVKFPHQRSPYALKFGDRSL